MIIIFIIFCILLGFLIAGLGAPAVMILNRSKIKTMHGIVAQFENALANNAMSYPEDGMRATRKRLLKIKSEILPFDKKAVEEARDIIIDFDSIRIKQPVEL